MSELYKTILQGEARIGAKVFKNSKAKKREFYCLDANTWIWRQDSSAVIYKINPSNIYKSNDAVSYRLVGKEEAKRLFQAAKVYRNLIEIKVYDSLLSLH